MSPSRRFLAAIVSVAAFTGCGGDGTALQEETRASATPSTTATATATPVRVPEPGKPFTVPADANIYGAGRDEAPAPGGGGGGDLPPMLALPKGSKTVTFPSITGQITGLVGRIPEHGPDGTPTTTSNVDSFAGISGVIHQARADYLVGVFLTDQPPSGKAPPRLDVTKGERQRSVAPKIAQTFYVGTGDGLSVKVPPKATRLFLGFAAARSGRGSGANGPPGFYANNRGELEITAEVAG